MNEAWEPGVGFTTCTLKDPVYLRAAPNRLAVIDVLAPRQVINQPDRVTVTLVFDAGSPFGQEGKEEVEIFHGLLPGAALWAGRRTFPKWLWPINHGTCAPSKHTGVFMQVTATIPGAGSAVLKFHFDLLKSPDCREVPWPPHLHLGPLHHTAHGYVIYLTDK